VSEPATDKSRQSDDKASVPETLPPASFHMLVATLATQASCALGQIPDPLSGKREVRLELARHVIDTLGILQAKTKGNLDAGEQDVLEGSLHQLRLAYLEATTRK
jgi:hypothetical protein